MENLFEIIDKLGSQANDREVLTRGPVEFKSEAQKEEEKLQAHFAQQAELVAAGQRARLQNVELRRLERLLSDEEQARQEQHEKEERSKLYSQNNTSSISTRSMYLNMMRAALKAGDFRECIALVKKHAAAFDTCNDILGVFADKQRSTQHPYWTPFVAELLTYLHSLPNFKSGRVHSPASFLRLCVANLDSSVVRSLLIDHICKNPTKTSSVESRCDFAIACEDYMFVKDWLEKTEHKVYFTIRNSYVKDTQAMMLMSLVLKPAVSSGRLRFEDMAGINQFVPYWDDLTVKKYFAQMNPKAWAVVGCPKDNALVLKRKLAHSIYLEYVLPLIGLDLPPYVVCEIIELLVDKEMYPHFYGIAMIMRMTKFRATVLAKRNTEGKKIKV